MILLDMTQDPLFVSINMYARMLLFKNNNDVLYVKLEFMFQNTTWKEKFRFFLHGSIPPLDERTMGEPTPKLI